MQNQYDCYAAWAFKENPFQPTPLHPEPRGERLLVGRDAELNQVKARLHRQSKITCVEGPVGVGKTSLVNIAAYQCLQGFIRDEANQLLVPCRTAFQLVPKDSADSFCTQVFVEVAQTLLDRASEVRTLGIDLHGRSALDAWLNSPQIAHVEIGLKAYLEVARKTELNESPGFSAHGFENLVRKWLSEVFPARGGGGVVCIIDNLELLETGAKAKKMLERLRDRLLNVEGLRWVFCGAKGIVSSVVASPRLSGYLIRPVMPLASLHPDTIPELLQRRITEFTTEPGKEYLPLLTADLVRLYWILNYNLRDLLAHADDYCMYIFESSHKNLPKTSEDKARRFDSWLKKQTVDEYQALSKMISRDAWELLDTAMSEDMRGSFGPGDFNYFKKNSFRSIEYKTFLTYMGKFEDLGVVTRTLLGDEGDERRRILFTVTSKGALVHFARFQMHETRTMAKLWLRRVATREG